MELNQVSGAIVDSAMKVHTALGAGMLESTYEICLIHELRKRKFNVQSQLALPVVYDGIKLDAGYRIDLLVESAVIVELKAVERFLPVHEAQLLSYLKLSRKKLGLLLNFNVAHFKNGIRRIVNNF